jgi:hypothetical protein
VEAVYMLRPDLAPAPRVKLEDIFALIETGPLAAETTREQPSFGPLASPNEMDQPDPLGVALQTEDIPTELALDRPDPVTEKADSSNVVQLSFYQRHRRNLWTGTGTLAAAAVALFLILPVRQQAALLGQVLQDPRASVAPAPPTAPMREGRADREGQAESKKDASLLLKPIAEETVGAASEQIERVETLKNEMVRAKAAGAPPSDQDKKAAPRVQEDIGARGGIGLWEGDAAQSGSGPRSGGRSGGGGGGAAFGTGSGSFGRSPAPAPAQNALQVAEMEGLETSWDFESAEDEMVASEARPTEGTLASRSRREGGREQRTSARKSRARASADAASPAMADAAPAAPEPGAPSELDAWAVRAQVKDYRSDWYTSVLSATLIAEIHEAISLASDGGRYQGSYVPPGVASPNTGASSDPAARYEQWIQHADVRVAQDMAWRAAESALRQGQLARALELIARGRARSSANTPYYAHLLELEGTIRRRQGDLQGAQEAWQAAALLNDARSG